MQPSNDDNESVRLETTHTNGMERKTESKYALEKDGSAKLNSNMACAARSIYGILRSMPEQAKVPYKQRQVRGFCKDTTAL